MCLTGGGLCQIAICGDNVYFMAACIVGRKRDSQLHESCFSFQTISAVTVRHTEAALEAVSRKGAKYD